MAARLQRLIVGMWDYQLPRLAAPSDLLRSVLHRHSPILSLDARPLAIGGLRRMRRGHQGCQGDRDQETVRPGTDPECRPTSLLLPAASHLEIPCDRQPGRSAPREAEAPALQQSSLSLPTTQINST